MPITQKVTLLPPAPDPAVDQPAEFSQKGAASVLAQRALPGELNSFADQANALAVEVNSAAVEATAQAAAAKAAVGAAAWVSGKTYQKNEGAISQVNFQTYRRRVAGAGTTDPANDSTNWAMLAGSGSFIPQPVLSTAIDLSIGNDFYIELNGSRTLAFNNCPQDGYSFTLDIDVTSGVVTLPASVRTPNNTPYVLTAGKGHSLMFRTRNRGARWRLVAATNFDL